MLETSEVYNKYSKSVSYETLVGGTATIGTEIKQTRQLSKGSAIKPLSAVGTLTSLLCNSAKVMEKLLRHVITRRTLVRRGYLPPQNKHLIVIARSGANRDAAIFHLKTSVYYKIITPPLNRRGRLPRRTFVLLAKTIITS